MFSYKSSRMWPWRWFFIRELNTFHDFRLHYIPSEFNQCYIMHNLRLSFSHPLLDCEECQSFYREQCETHGPPSFTPDSPTPLGVPQRALLTLPPGLMVGRSSIPGAGLGVFNQGQVVPVGMHFGPFEGEVTSREKAIESSYSWVVSP